MTFLDRIKETSTSTGTGTFTLGGAVLGYKVFTNGTYKYCIVNETESEWEVGEGTVTSGVLTRTTIEASSNGGAAVSFSAGTKYVFNTVSAAYVNSLVPYTGATASVNLGAYGLTSDYLQLSTTPTASGAVGRTIWNDSIGSTQTTLKGGSVLLKNGVDLVARVVNKVTPAATLTKATYKAVRVSGAQGQRLAIAYAQANNDNNSADTIGLVCETIAANQEGFIITVGQLTGINTTGSLQGETWADGDVLYLSPTTAGNLTNIKPTGATGHIVVVGYVEYSHAINGSIYVKIMNGWELDELHNVYINAVANNDVLVYESSSTLWKNKSIATILGYTPQAAITLTTTGNNGASTFVSNTLNIPTYTLAGLGGQPQLNGTGFVKATGTTISYDNTTYATDSLVVHLAGAETITGVKTFQNALQTTTGNNLLNTGGGNTVIGYTADPASSATYKLDVNGTAKLNGVVSISGVVIGVGTLANGQSIKGSASGNFTFNNSGGGGWYYEWIQNSATAMTLATDNSLLLGTTTSVSSSILTLNSTTKGVLLPRMTTAQKTAITTPATSLLVYDTDLAAFQYYTGSAWTSLGGGITGSGTAGQVTYWSGTSAVTGSSNLVWDNTNSRLSIAAGASPAYRLQVHGSMRVGTTAASAMYWDDTNNRLGIGVTGPTSTLHIQGAGNTSATNALLVQNSAGTEILRVYNDGSISQSVLNSTFTIGGPLRFVSTSPSISGTNILIESVVTGVISIAKSAGITSTSGSISVLNIGSASGNFRAFAPTSGTATYIVANILAEINQTGGANGITRGLYINPTLTAAADWRSIEWSNNSGWGLYGAGTASNYVAGNFGFQQTSPTSIADFGASTNAKASLRIRSGTAPTSPNDGDIWYDGTNIYIRVGTTTKTFTII